MLLLSNSADGRNGPHSFAKRLDWTENCDVGRELDLDDAEQGHPFEAPDIAEHRHA